MASVTIRPDINRIRQWLEKIADEPARRRILIQGTLELADRARVYPEEGPWNYEPGTGKHGWYQRQFGPRRRRKDGTVWGKNTSQRLQKNWKTQIGPDAEKASVYTNVTYAPYLYDPVRRVGWAASHGWETVDEIADGYAARFEQIILDEIDRNINRD